MCILVYIYGLKDILEHKLSKKGHCLKIAFYAIKSIFGKANLSFLGLK